MIVVMNCVNLHSMKPAKWLSSPRWMGHRTGKVRTQSWERSSVSHVQNQRGNGGAQEIGAQATHAKTPSQGGTEHRGSPRRKPRPRPTARATARADGASSGVWDKPRRPAPPPRSSRQGPSGRNTAHSVRTEEEGVKLPGCRWREFVCRKPKRLNKKT